MSEPLNFERPLRPSPDSGAAALSLEVRCPHCNRLLYMRSERTLVVLIIVLHRSPPSRGVTLKCKCGTFLQEYHEDVAA